MLADGVGKHTNMLSAWYDANGKFIPAEENLPPRRTLTLVERLDDLKARLKGGVGGMPLPNPRSSNFGSQKTYMIQLLDGISRVPAKCDFKKQEAGVPASALARGDGAHRPDSLPHAHQASC